MLLCCTACGGTKVPENTDPVDKTPVDQVDNAQGYSDDEIVDVRILVAEYSDPAYPRRWDRPALKQLKEIARTRFGINFVLEEVIGGDDNYKTILNTKLAANEDVPDVIRFDFNVNELNQMYFNGQILNLSDYAEYMPEVVASFEELPSMKQYNCNSEGDILRIPSIAYNIQHVSTWGNIRRDWLDKLKLESPTTTEELRKVLRAFQENDMNGNGVKDEVYITYFEAMNTTLAPAFGAYGLSEATKSWYAGEDGVVYSSMLTQEAKNYVEYVASMFAEGLFWSESFSDNGSQKLTLESEDRSAGQFGRYWDSLLTTINDYSYGRPSEYNPILPLTDGTHPAKILMADYLGSTTITLTKNCPAPERVVAFMNWCYSEEAGNIIYCGEPLTDGKGTYYEEVLVKDLVSDEIAQLLELKGDEMTAQMTEAGKALDKQESNMSGYLGAQSDLFPVKAINTPAEIALDFYSAYDQEASRSAGTDIEMNYRMLSYAYQEGNSYQNIPLAVATEEQSDILSDYSDLFVYMNEMYKRFMLGVEPMSNWDTFVQQCYDQGMDDVLKVMQERYDALQG